MSTTSNHEQIRHCLCLSPLILNNSAPGFTIATSSAIMKENKVLDVKWLAEFLGYTRHWVSVGGDCHHGYCTCSRYPLRKKTCPLQWRLNGGIILEVETLIPASRTIEKQFNLWCSWRFNIVIIIKWSQELIRQRYVWSLSKPAFASPIPTEKTHFIMV